MKCPMQSLQGITTNYPNWSWHCATYKRTEEGSVLELTEDPVIVLEPQSAILATLTDQISKKDRGEQIKKWFKHKIIDTLSVSVFQKKRNFEKLNF